MVIGFAVFAMNPIFADELPTIGVGAGSSLGTRHGSSDPDFDWMARIREEIPVIAGGMRSRWPLVSWKGPDARRLSRRDVEDLAARGIAPVIRLEADYLMAARRIAAVGLPVIYLEGRGGRWPYAESGAGSEETLDPGRFDGWRRAAQRLRERALAFREAGVTIDAAWLDFENAPLNIRLDDVVEGSTVPAAALEGEERFRVYRRQLWMSLMSAYVAAPLREVFPLISITNWIVSASRPDFPLLDWYNRPHPRTDIGLFTATNPIAYASDVAFWNNAPSESPITPAKVDRIYTHVLLRQVSADTHARQRDAPHLQSVVWVSRRVHERADVATPSMSREAYREALRHIWLRGADAMQVFNPVRDGFEKVALWELIDAAAIYRETANDWPLFARRDVMNLAVPDPHRFSVFWSGVRGVDEALLRISNPLPVGVGVDIDAWGDKLRLEARPGNWTVRVDRADLSVSWHPGGLNQPGGS